MTSSARTALPATLAGFVLIWLVLDRTAAGLGSFRGEAGCIVCAATLAAAFAVEAALARRPPLQIARDLGLGAPRGVALLCTLGLCAALLAFLPLYGWLSGVRIALRADAGLLAVGLLAQAGIAEETLFRGFLFRRMRAGRRFWAGALVAAVPFAAVHALLFLSMAPALAAAALALSVAMSFPLAWLYERAGGSVWPPALLHAVTQGAIKLIEVEGGEFSLLALAWMGVTGLAPWSVFLLLRAPRAG